MNTTGIEKQLKVGLHNNQVSFWIRKSQDEELEYYFTCLKSNTRVVWNIAHIGICNLNIPCLHIVHSNSQLKIHSLIT